MDELRSVDLSRIVMYAREAGWRFADEEYIRNDKPDTVEITIGGGLVCVATGRTVEGEFHPNYDDATLRPQDFPYGLWLKISRAMRGKMVRRFCLF